MDAVEYLKTLSRLCKGKCSDCPLCAENNSTGERCVTFVLHKSEEAVKAVEKWGKEHPIKTRQSEFLKVFPNATLDIKGVVIIAPCTILKTNGCRGKSCNDCRREYWLSPIED